MQTTVGNKEEVLVERLRRGAELLFDMEQRGEMGADYRQWLQRWMDLLAEYENLQAA